MELNSSHINYLFENCDRIERIDNFIVNSSRPLDSMNRTFYGCTNLSGNVKINSVPAPSVLITSMFS